MVAYKRYTKKETPKNIGETPTPSYLQLIWASETGRETRLGKYEFDVCGIYMTNKYIGRKTETVRQK